MHPNSNENDFKNIGEYFIALIEQLWFEGEGFSGKRPFGNSGWKFDIYAALVYANAIEGKFDSDGYLEYSDSSSGNRMIFDMIKDIKKRWVNKE